MKWVYSTCMLVIHERMNKLDFLNWFPFWVGIHINVWNWSYSVTGIFFDRNNSYTSLSLLWKLWADFVEIWRYKNAHLDYCPELNVTLTSITSKQEATNINVNCYT